MQDYIKTQIFPKEIDNFYPSKKMGQNFLINEDVLDDIQTLLNISKFDCIVEIGPGLGHLTNRLLRFKKPLYLIELDKRLFDYLNKKYKNHPNITLFCDDVLQFDFKKITEQHKNPCIVANLPYSISSPFIIRFLQFIDIKCMYCMLQKEVVERLVAKPRTSTFNSFSCLFQHYATATPLLSVPNSSFHPQPKVDSVFIHIQKKQTKQYDIGYGKYLKKVFTAKRKTFFNNLKNYYPIDARKQIMNKFNIKPLSRSEEISEMQHYKIYLTLNK